MRKKSLKAAALAVMAGTLLQFGFGGCLGPVLQEAFIEIAADQVSVFLPGDLFGSLLGGGTGG